MTTRTRTQRRMQRKMRIRAKVVGSETRPRLAVFRSNKHFYAQLIDDGKGQTLAAVSDRNLSTKAKKGDVLYEIAKEIAEHAKKRKIKTIVFDRSGYKYHGQVKTLAEALREQGLAF